jgi:integrase
LWPLARSVLSGTGRKSAARSQGVANDDAHVIRHTAASLAVQAGANVKAVQRMLGHASAAMPLDVYADLFDDDLDSVADRLDEGLTRSHVAQLWATEPVRNRPR